MVFPDSFLHDPQHPHSAINIEDEDVHSEMSQTEAPGPWFIPRPALCRDATTCDCNSSRSIQTVSEWLSPSTSSTPSSSKSSTQSGSSGTLLLTAANLAALRLEQQIAKPYDTQSLASSTHFTVVNGMSRKPLQKTADCCRTCHKHQLTAVVVTVCGLFLIGLSLAVYYIDMRARGALS
ncbi:uncharacterized protein LOC128987542 [Macrosteles quadrilineatus]|uniref:uncharacterized protein LOC128987542 n=1 Tax=Macrosteles quadrilineatus TaxID=74068 RepID=UPI0023E1931E|nr:uncharacterized protein LOC128987542 [Macrosteles quadrilineatus]